MKRHVVNVCVVLAAVLFLSISVLQLSAEARIGGSRSFGSRGSRSYSKPASTYSQPSPSRQQLSPSAGPFQQQAGGGLMRGMAGGIMGGMLGSMLFGGTAGAGTGGTGGGGGIGLFDIALLGGVGYLIYRVVRPRIG